MLLVDPLGEFARFTRALGELVIRIGPGGSERLNPLDPISTGGDRAAKAGRVGTMLRALFPSLTDAEGALLDGRLSQLYRRVLRPRFGPTSSRRSTADREPNG